jgi:hypothetical protein
MIAIKKVRVAGQIWDCSAFLADKKLSTTARAASPIVA